MGPKRLASGGPGDGPAGRPHLRMSGLRLGATAAACTQRQASKARATPARAGHCAAPSAQHAPVQVAAQKTRREGQGRAHARARTALSTRALNLPSRVMDPTAG
eukprot:4830914-Alexandrium_andersonii.AAC.1